MLLKALFIPVFSDIFSFLFFFLHIKLVAPCRSPCCHWERRSLVRGELLQKAHASAPEAALKHSAPYLGSGSTPRGSPQSFKST